MNLQLPGDFRHAMAKDSSRYAICGAEVRKAGPDRVLVTATDGRILSMRLQGGEGPDAPTIIPGEMMPTLKGGGTITQDGENALHLIQGKKTLIGETGLGQFPPTADILPEVTGVADLGVVRAKVDSALESLEAIHGGAPAGQQTVSADTLASMIRDLKAAQVELQKSHVREVGISGVLLHNLARSLNAGGGEGNLGVTLIIPMKASQPIAVLPHGSYEVDSLGVIMPVNLGGVDAGTWERRRKSVLEAMEPAEEADQGDAAADQGDALAETAQGQTDPDGVEAPAQAGNPDMDSAGGDGQYERGYPEAGR